MLNSAPNYRHLSPSSELPSLEGLRQFKAVVVVEADVLETMMWDVSRWLVDSGCLYALVWGKDSEQWREAIEDASLEAADYEDLPAERQVQVTSHEDDDLDEVFWFARHRAAHAADLKQTLILHLADVPRRDELEAQFRDA
jgi:hypothetical protein